MRRRASMVVVAVGAILLAIVIVVAVVHTRASAAPVAGAICPAPSYGSYPPGKPAISPRNDCTPSFTEQDARDYLARNLQSSLPHIAVIGQAHVSSVRFLTVRDLDRARGQGDYTGAYPPDMVVCYATLRGTFVSQGTATSQPTTSNAAYIVFDAHTGNELGAGGIAS